MAILSKPQESENNAYVMTVVDRIICGRELRKQCCLLYFFGLRWKQQLRNDSVVCWLADCEHLI